VSALYVDEFVADSAGVAMPHAEPQLVVRFGQSIRGGVDVHAMGARERAVRKRIRAGQRSVIARLRLGMHQAVLGVPSHALAGRHVALEDLWGRAAAGELLGRLAEARAPLAAAAIVDRAIAQRLAATDSPRTASALALEAAAKLESGKVSEVAAELGVSGRNLRRVFRDAVGMSPKAYARLARFQRALRAAQGGADWAQIAADAGYYDQAHLIAEFRDIAGVTPRALLQELGHVSPKDLPRAAGKVILRQVHEHAE
jgi:AraC-like DNA-binding protein